MSLWSKTLLLAMLIGVALSSPQKGYNYPVPDNGLYLPPPPDEGGPLNPGGSSPDGIGIELPKPPTTTTRRPVTTARPRPSTYRPRTTARPRPTTRAPVRTTTRAPYRPTTRAPVRTTTRAPYRPTTRAPVRTTTRAPYRPTTRAPVRTTTRVPYRPTTRAPVRTTTRAPYRPTTRAPVRTTTRAPYRPPVNPIPGGSGPGGSRVTLPTTRRPIITTRRPVITTRRPVITTRRPVVTTRRPVVTRRPAPGPTTTAAPAGGSKMMHMSRPYEFGYDIDDTDTDNAFSQKETSDGMVITGEYRWKMPDGRTQIVTYLADWAKGYYADIRYE